MPITEAAQAVQRSAFPDAYADHEADARALASALTGETTGGRFSCVTRADVDAESDDLDDAGLTARAATVREEVRNAFGELPMGGFEPGGATEGHMPGSAHYDGRAVDIFVRPVSAENKRLGWAVAQYLVAQSDRLAIRTVIFDDRIWTAGDRSDQGWRDYDPPSTERRPGGAGAPRPRACGRRGLSTRLIPKQNLCATRPFLRQVARFGDLQFRNWSADDARGVRRGRPDPELLGGSPTMHNSSTILTVGTALRHAQDGAARVHVLLGGTWMTGSVIGVDGEGAVLESENGDTTVVRMQAITAVRVEKLAQAASAARVRVARRRVPT